MPRSKPISPLLLDTHVWIWYAEKDRRLSDTRCLRGIRRASQENRLCIATISLWEVAILEFKERIRLHMDCLAWIRHALSTSDISLITLSPEIAVESARLPGHLPGDPADRIIVATARVLDGALVTADEALLEYARGGHLDVMLV